MENMQLALSLLLAGFLIVFTVLVTLIIIILIYGKIIQKAQKTVAVRREKKAIIRVEELQSQSPASDVPAGGKVFGDDPEQIPGEIIAVIAAAVDALYGEKPHRIRSVTRERKGRSSWGSAGVFQNTRPF